MRIVGGSLRGRALAGPSSVETRATSDRLRESIFNVLVHSYDNPVAGGHVLDLFAGTGALGIEALSRGADFALCVENAPAACRVIEANREALKLGETLKVFRRDARRMGTPLLIQPFSLVFCDPPYGLGLGEQALASCAAGGWIAPGAIAVWEEDAKADIVWPEGFPEIERRDYGKTQVRFGRFGLSD